MQKVLETAIAQQRLPEAFIETIKQWYLPLIETLYQKFRVQGATLVVGVQGSQGSGKSTLASFISILLHELHGLNVAVLSLDDFYLTAAQRESLAESVHPLLNTRGVPGTHDVNLAISTISALSNLAGNASVAIPRFNKALDDRASTEDWDQVKNKVDVIVFEGWCAGAEAQTEAELRNPVNELERTEDQDGVWRNYVNQQLQDVYSQLFSLIDFFIVLEAPSFECVYQWRTLQEKKLEQQWRNLHPSEPAKILNAKQLKRFIQHYERLTRHCLASLPERAEYLFKLDESHEIVQGGPVEPSCLNT